MSDIIIRVGSAGSAKVGVENTGEENIHIDGQSTIKGKDGFSPVVESEQIEGGHKVTITDEKGPHEFDVMDGEKGDDGDPGPKGDTGFSPTVSIEDIDGGHRVNITDEDGTQSFDVMDGRDGDAPISSGIAAEDDEGNIWYAPKGKGLNEDLLIVDEYENPWHVQYGKGYTGDLTAEDEEDTSWYFIRDKGIEPYDPVIPPGGQIGDLLWKESGDTVGWVTPASNAEADNTRPITAAAVYTEIGNINALLATI